MPSSTSNAGELFAHKDYNAKDYAAYRPSYPKELYEAILAFEANGREGRGKMETILDVGCGPGTATFCLREYGTRVIGQDFSEVQIAAANEKAKEMAMQETAGKEGESCSEVSFCVGPAEELHIGDHTCDVVTTAQALHWFDHPKFFAEVKRVLRKGTGTLAVWTYSAPVFEKCESAQSFFKEKYDALPWDWRRLDYVDKGYESIPFPFEEVKKKEFKVHKQMSLSFFLGYLSTWSPMKELGSEKAAERLADIRRGLLKAHGRGEGDDPESLEISLFFGIKLILARNS